MIEFYYGMSGSMKSTTISQQVDTSLADDVKVMYSLIKPWKNLENGIFKEFAEPNDINFAMMHLCQLENNVKNMDCKKDVLFVERGVSDMLFYKNITTPLSDKFIKSVVDKEIEFCRENKVYKMLLIMKDLHFIENVILKNKHRANVFKDVDDYITKQSEYVEFTMKHNKIDNIKEIDDAVKYIKELDI